MVEHTQQPMPGSVEVVRPVAPGDGTVRADEDVAAGAEIAPAGRPLRPQDLGMLAAAGVEVAVHRRPRVGIVSTGDEVVSAGPVVPRPGQVRDATASALAAWSPTPVVSRCSSGWWPTTRRRWSPSLTAAV